MTWLSDNLQRLTLTEEVEDYLLGRGAKEETIAREGFKTWTPSDKPVEDDIFRERYGDHGEALDGWLVCPAYSPKGNLIAAEIRNIQEKKVAKINLADTNWNPYFLGLKSGMEKIWNGADIWIVEGVFDLFALEWGISDKNVVLATGGAHLMMRHVTFLKRFCSGWVCMAYDQDDPGQKATHGWKKKGKKVFGALESLQRLGIPCREIKYRGKDPGVIWDQGGEEAIKAAFPI